MRMQFSLPRLAVFGLLPAIAVLAFGCGMMEVGEPSLKSQAVTEENSAQLAIQARQELSYDEYRLLQDYVRRVHPDLSAERLPVGLSIATMIESQRDFEGAQARQAETSPAAAASPTEQVSAVPPRAQAQPTQRPAPTTPPAATAAAPSVTEQAPAPAVDAPLAAQPETTASTTLPPPLAPTTALLPAGTPLNIRLAETISSKRNQPGDAFEATLEDDLVVDGRRLAPAGSRIVGRISDVEASGRVRGRARMSISLARIHVGDETYSLPTNTLNFEAEGTAGDDAKKIGIASGIGAVIGAIAGGGKGAAIGGAIGAGAGTGTVLATTGDEVEFRVEQLFSFRTSREVEMPIPR
jgi:hypothetical protein